MSALSAHFQTLINLIPDNTCYISLLKAFTCADLANLVNVAAIKAAVEGAEKLNSKQLEFAKDRIMMGTERKTMFVTEESKKVSILVGGMNLMQAPC